jgi:hypothetical protein
MMKPYLLPDLDALERALGVHFPDTLTVQSRALRLAPGN